MKKGDSMEKKKMINNKKMVIPFAAMTTMFLSAAMPVFAAKGFVFEDLDLGVVYEEEKTASGSETKATASNAKAASSNAKATSSNAKAASSNAKATASNAKATSSDASEDNVPVINKEDNVIEIASQLSMARMSVSSSLGNLWDNWDTPDLSFLDGTHGVGTKSKPYQIRTKQQLMGLSYLAAFGMQPDHGEVEEDIVGDYRNSWFELTANIDLGGMDWNPIGYYRDDSEFSGDVTHPFTANIDGNGYKISNFRLAKDSFPDVGFFGALDGAVVRNLTLEPGKPVKGIRHVGILSGTAKNSSIFSCNVKGDVEGNGTVGGLVGLMEGGTVENASAQVTVNAIGRASGAGLAAGGIAGEASNGANIIDCQVRTGDNSTSRIQGTDASVGGIVGIQNDANIYNIYVNGTIGGSGSQNVGGFVGERISGDLKVGRFEGTIGQSGTGAAGHRGTFIGYRAPANYFKYGDDIAYLFADTEEKIANNVCGSGISDDNQYTYAAHIGYSHSKDNFFTLVSGGVTRDIENKYFYEELEEGILSIVDDELGGEMNADVVGYDLDHFAPNDAGRPIRGYLITIPQIDTVSGGTNYYDVAALEAKGNGAYYKTLDKEHRGAVAPGKTVTVSTSANNTEKARFQMVDVPTYTLGQKRQNTTYVKGGEYSFTMPEENTQVSAVYKKVAVSVGLTPAVTKFQVVEERTGDRKNPTKTTRVMDGNGKLIATYINGNLKEGTKVQAVNVEAIVDQNNDVEDSSVKWSIDDTDLITLLPNDDEENGYTKKGASIQLNLNSSFIVDIVRKLEKEQADRAYQYAIGSDIYGAGYQNGGVAVLTAQTKPAESFDEKSCKGNARIEVTFQIKDKTYVANEGASLSHDNLKFEVIRTLTGDRKNPKESISVTAPKVLGASFIPDYFDKKDISWTVGDDAIISVDGENKSASVKAKKDAKWIRDLITEDQGKHANKPYERHTASGSKNSHVTVIGDDMLGNRQTATCNVEVEFKTVDETVVRAEGVNVSPSILQYDVKRTRTGSSSWPTESFTGTDAKKLTTSVFPAQTENKNVTYYVSDDSLYVANDGTVTVNTNASWIKDMDRNYKNTGSHTSCVTVKTEDGGFTTDVAVEIQFEAIDQTYRSSSRSGGGSGGGSSSGSSQTAAGNSQINASGPALQMNSYGSGVSNLPGYVVIGNWQQDAYENWTFETGGRILRSEWAAIYNPYADISKGQSSFDWFCFDSEGKMITGWYADTDGNTYYLWPVSDGTKGRMLTGWNWLPADDGISHCYYFQEESDGFRGRLCKNTKTPDENFVNESVFSDQHPEINDREYYLREMVLYPEDSGEIFNAKGEPKANYSESAVAELKKFVNGFDWIHADEKTRLKYVHDRIANGEGGFNNNHYGNPDRTKNLPVLESGVGVCRDFATEFKILCQSVGLECVTYTPQFLHEACLVKIGIQWYATDPTSSLPLFSNSKTYPVDYETEYYRYENEKKEKYE